MKRILSSVILLSILIANPLFSQKCNQSSGEMKLSKSQQNLFYSKFNINNISTYVYNNGEKDGNPNGNSGFEFPKGSGKTSVFTSGILFAGKVDGRIKMNGSAFSSGMQPGRILPNGTAEDTKSSNVRVFRVRPDYKTADLTSEINDGEGTGSEIREIYEKDWNEWRGNDGAPFEDINNNGVYEPLIDIPGVPGADQTLWYVTNDLGDVNFDVAQPSKLGIEIQTTIWGYNREDEMGNMLFKKYKILNKGIYNIDSIYVAQFSDTEIGSSSGDFAGCDTLLNLGFGYNAQLYDELYGLNPAAVGYCIVQGPMVEGEATDKAYFDGNFIQGKKNLPLRAYVDFTCGGTTFPYPHWEPSWYNYFQGKLQNGAYFKTPYNLGKKPTTFSHSGNPLTGEGWLDGNEEGCGDRNILLSTGPFNLASGDFQEIVIAEIAAMGSDNLNSIALLKYYASLLHTKYPNFDINSQIPEVSKLIPSLNQLSLDSDVLIQFDILSSETIENYSELGYTFQGFNIYQLPFMTENKLVGKKIFSFDIIDDIANIYGETYDPSTGYLITDLIQEGSNSGFPNSFSITQDYFNNGGLIKGKEYYYGISAYYYNSDPNAEFKVIESELNSVSIVFQKGVQGPNYMDLITSSQTSGKADVEVVIEVVDPLKLTGDTYEITFAEQHYYRDSDGEWKKTNYPDSIGKSLNKPSDQIASTLIPMTSIYGPNNTIDVHFSLERNSPDNNRIDAVSITFPDGIVINGAENAKTNITPIIEDQTVTWGEPGILSANGPFWDGHDFIVNINEVEPTFTVDYIIYDDGWAESIKLYYPDYFNLGEGTVNGYGSVTLNGEIGYEFKTERYWNLFNKTQKKIALEYQTIFGGRDLSETRGQPLPYNYEPIVDGFRIKLDGTFNNPKSYYQAVINGEQLNLFYPGQNIRYGGFVISDYTYFGYENGTSFFANGYGTKDPVKLSQDYEFRFTGKRDSTIINGKKVYITKDGTGSLATCYGARNYDYTYHPLNNSGLNRFLVRIPFEVWNKDLGIQVNYQFYDRSQLDPTVDGFYVWNPNGRMYGEILNTPYTGLLISQTMTETLSDEFTWNNVWVKSNYITGDIVEINYRNPIQSNEVITFNSNDIINSFNNNLPVEYKLYNNYPNPFNPITKIKYSLPNDSKVNLSIYDILGQKVNELVNESLKAGEYETVFDASYFASGVYIYRIEVDSPNNANVYSQTKKMLLLK